MRAMLLKSRADGKAKAFDSLPWRGQASPDFVGKLLENYATGSSVLDPFSGSGTTLFQAQMRDLPCIGADINPAAFLISSRVQIAGISSKHRDRLVSEAQAVIAGICRNRFRSVEAQIDYQRMPEITGLKLVVSLAVMAGLGSTGQYAPEKIATGFSKISRMVEAFHAKSITCQSLLCDARQLDIADGSVGLVLTFPPALTNILYYRNYRSAVELLGWKPRESALSEIGSNGKISQNTFFSVIQYCLDMHQVLLESSRVLENGGRLVLVANRSVTILGATVYVGKLLRDLLELGSKFKIFEVSERIFTDRFGRLAYQDVIVAENDKKKVDLFKTETAVASGILALEHALIEPNSSAKPLIKDAISKAYGVKSSSLFNQNFPAGFA